MAEITEIVGGLGAESRALDEALRRIRERAQTQLRKPLEVEYSMPHENEGGGSYFRIGETHQIYWGFGIIPIPCKDMRKMFRIYPTCHRDAGKKVVDCTLFEPSIKDIIKEEIQKYADAVQATAIELRLQFS